MSLGKNFNAGLMAQDSKDMDVLSYRLQLLFPYTPRGLFEAFEFAQVLRDQDIKVEFPQQPFDHAGHGKCLVLETGSLPERIYNDIQDIRSDRERETGKVYIFEIIPHETRQMPKNSIMRDKMAEIFKVGKSPV